VFVVGKNYRLQDIQLSKSRYKLVENTGLEPVTSWLQTRRSPSWANSPKTLRLLDSVRGEEKETGRFAANHRALGITQ
jgi:hypothetical protein